MKAAIYSRFSTDRQTDSSIADQVRVCTEYAARQGWEVSEHFEDQGISGAAVGNRPGFLAMMRAAQDRRFEALIVMDLSRLSRSNADLAKTIDRLAFTRIRVVGVHDGFDSAREGHELISGFSGIMGQAFRKMVAKKTFAALESRAKTQRPTGGRAYGYRDDKVDKGAAFMVLEIFGRFADGVSCRAIAAELNSRRIPSPGASWKRTERRGSGWMGSAIRALLRNDRYVGRIVWNRSEWVKDPDSGKRLRRERPESEWITHQDESLRIVPDDLWARAQRRIKATAADGNWGTTRGKPKYLLSGLLRCEVCGAHYVICNAVEYSCSSFVNGRACTNDIRVSRDRLQEVILGPVQTGLLAPERIQTMQREMQAYYAEKVKAGETRAIEAPKELQELEARIDRLRERLRAGDPDMTAGDIQAAIERAQAKCQELRDSSPAAKQSAKMFAFLPKAAELYRRQIAQGLEGNPREALKARVFLREAFEGRIGMEPGEDGSLWAVYGFQPAALLRSVGNGGSGGRI
jgi:site-specific DNA recombinase